MARTKGFGDIRVSPRNQRLLKWLRRKPCPHTIVGETEDGEERRAVVSLTGPTIWADVLSVVRPCVNFSALDKEGNTLRVLELDPDDPELRAEAEAESLQRIVGQHGAVPLISVDVPKLVDSIARNMREVAQESAKQQAGAYKEGFGAMVNVVNLCLNLLTRIDERMAEQEQHTPVVEAPAAADPRAQMAMMALQKAMGGGGNGAPNGGGVNMAQLLQLVQQFQQQPTPEGEPQ